MFQTLQGLELTYKLMMLSRGGFASASWGDGAGMVAGFLASTLAHVSMMVAGSSLPLKQSGVRPSRTTEDEWISAYSLVASRPAYLRMTAAELGQHVAASLLCRRRCVPEGPPGCSGTNRVTSQTSPSMTIQQSSGLLCCSTVWVEMSWRWLMAKARRAPAWQNWESMWW